MLEIALRVAGFLLFLYLMAVAATFIRGLVADENWMGYCALLATIFYVGWIIDRRAGRL